MWKPLIICGSDVAPYNQPCEFYHLVTLVQNLITDLVIISTFLATFAFAYAGIKLLASGGNESAKTEAKNIFRQVLIGYLWILGAWVVIYTILKALGVTDAFNFLTKP